MAVGPPRLAVPLGTNIFKQGGKTIDISVRAVYHFTYDGLVAQRRPILFFNLKDGTFCIIFFLFLGEDYDSGIDDWRNECV